MNGTDGGWLKMYRKFRESPVWGNLKLEHVFIWCLLSAEFQPTVKGIGLQQVNLESGQFLTTLAAASASTLLSVKEVRNALAVLEQLNMIARKGANKFTIISIVNWQRYQISESDLGQAKGKQRANKGHAINKEEEVKKLKNSVAAVSATAESSTSRLSAATERESAAAQIDTLYRQLVPNPYNRKLSPKKSIPRILAILKSGISEEALTGAVKRYAKEALTAPPDKRKGIRGFFSAKDDMWEGYVAEDGDGEGAADGYIDQDDTWEASPQMLADYEEFCRQNRERDGVELIDGKLVKKGEAHERSDAVAGTA